MLNLRYYSRSKFRRNVIFKTVFLDTTPRDFELLTILDISEKDDSNITAARWYGKAWGPFNMGYKITSFEESLKFLLSLKVDILCEGHFGIFEGERDIQSFIKSFL